MKQAIPQPIITEKTLKLAQEGRFTFRVQGDASKPVIASLVAKHYGVQIINVQTIHVHGKVRRFGRKRIPIQLQDYKKAVVKVKKGQSIDAFLIPQKNEEK